MRERMTAMFQFNVIFGILIAYVSNYVLRGVNNDDWRWMLGIGAIPSFIYFFLLLAIDESPHYLIKRKKKPWQEKCWIRSTAKILING